MALSENGKEQLIEGAQSLGVSLDEPKVELLDEYLRCIEETNKHTNLTRIIGDEAVTGHFLDALSLAQALPLDTVKSVADVGTGVGVPGVVLKIVFPHLDVVLFDSLNKRITFLNNTIKMLGLEGIEALHLRAEDAGRDARHRGRFDLVTARAVASLDILSEYMLPLAKVGGAFVAYKGKLDESEAVAGEKQIVALGGQAMEIKKVSVPGLAAARVIVLAKKIKATPPKYPRTSSELSRDAKRNQSAKQNSKRG